MKGGKYYDITVLCAECSAKRLVPDYMSVKKHMEIKGVVTPSMGCRALLSPWKNPKTGELQTWGRAIVNAMNKADGIGICSATYTNIITIRRVL